MVERHFLPELSKAKLNLEIKNEMLIQLCLVHFRELLHMKNLEELFEKNSKINCVKTSLKTRFWHHYFIFWFH